MRQTAFLTALVLILPSLPTHSRFLLALVSTFVDPGGLRGKVTQSFILDRPESLVTLIVRGHGCYTSIYPTTIYSFTIKTKHKNTSWGSVMCQNILLAPTMQQVLLPLGHQSSVAPIRCLISLFPADLLVQGAHNDQWQLQL